MSIILIVFSIYLLTACNINNGNMYKLEVVDNWNLLRHPLEKEYEAGSIVEVHLAFRSGPSVGIKINGEVKVAKDHSMDCEEFCNIVTFTMPSEDTIIYTHQNGLIVKDCGEGNHQWGEGQAGTTSSVAPPPMKYTCLLCGEIKLEPGKFQKHTHNYVDGLCDCGEFDALW